MNKYIIFSCLFIALFVTVSTVEAGGHHRHCHGCRPKSSFSINFGQQTTRSPEVIYYAPPTPMVVTPYPAYGTPYYVVQPAPTYVIRQERPTSFFQWGFGFSHRFR